MKKFLVVPIVLCLMTIAHAGTATGLGDTRAEACATAKNKVPYGQRILTSCDCSKTEGTYYYCSVDYQDKDFSKHTYPTYKQDSNKRFTPLENPKQGSYILQGTP
jgi:hypothetical protein